MAAAVGVVDALERAGALVDAGAISCGRYCSWAFESGLRHSPASKANFKDVDVAAGNIATGEAARALIEAGADAIKVESDRGRYARQG